LLQDRSAPRATDLIARGAPANDEPCDRTNVADATLRTAWADFLTDAQAWSHYATLTFRPRAIAPVNPRRPHGVYPNRWWNPNPDYAREELRRFVRRIEQRTQGQVGYFWGTEHGRVGGRLHAHALLALGCELTYQRIKEAWKAGFARVLPCAGAEPYVSKYCTKGAADWDFRFAPQRCPDAIPVQADLEPRCDAVQPGAIRDVHGQVWA
jgi:hypothetical protein